MSKYSINFTDKTDNKMSNTFLLYHIVLRTKNSVPTIIATSEEILYRYIWRFTEEQKGILYAIGGMADHIHMLVRLPATVPLSDFMRGVKTTTSKFAVQHPSLFPTFDGWAKGYFCETYSHTQADVVRRYIKGQKEHHRKTSFYEELRKLYTDCGLDITPYFMQQE